MHDKTVLATTVLIEGFKQIGTILGQMTACLEQIPETPAEADTLAAVPKAPAAQESIPSQEPEKPAESEKEYSFEDVRRILTEKSSRGYRAEVKAILAGHKLNKLSEAKDQQSLLNRIAAEAEAIGNA